MRRPAQTKPPQGDLFDPIQSSDDDQPRRQVEPPFDPDDLTDDEIIAQLPNANLTKAETLCAQVVSRGLADAAVPALEKLWNRFRGFGINTPCREQLAVLGAFAKIKTEQSESLIKRLAEGHDLPAVLLPHVLEAAVACRVRFPQRRIELWTEDGRATVRARAYSLAQMTSLPLYRLEQGRSDPDISVREAVLITMGKLGHASARSGLLQLLAKKPNAEVVGAIASVADDEVIVRLGRCAEEHDGLRSRILEELKALDDPKATAVIRRLEE